MPFCAREHHLHQCHLSDFYQHFLMAVSYIFVSPTMHQKKKQKMFAFDALKLSNKQLENMPGIWNLRLFIRLLNCIARNLEHHHLSMHNTFYQMERSP